MKLMLLKQPIIIIPLILFALIFIYLFISYAGFYYFIGKINLKSPYLTNSLSLENPTGVGTAKYVALGDSLTAGVGSSTVDETFVYIYAQNLLKKYNKVDVLNLAQPGGTTVDVINYQLPNAIKENPDYITLLIGVNDLHNKRTNNNFREKYSFILNELLTKTNAKITVIEIPYIGSSKVVYPPFGYLLNVRTQLFNKTILSLVSEQAHTGRIQVAPLYKETYQYSKHNEAYYSEDLFHPSNEGYIYWGQIINAY